MASAAASTRGSSCRWRATPHDARSEIDRAPQCRRLFALDNSDVSSERERHGPATSRLSSTGETYLPTCKAQWKTNQRGHERLAARRSIACRRRTRSATSGISTTFPRSRLNNVWTDTVTSELRRSKVYVVQTNTKVVERCLLMTTDPGDLVLDPTCGSGTTAYVAEQWGRRWITIDTSRVALALARTRLMAARFPYYLLADSPEGTRKEAELTGAAAADAARPTATSARGSCTSACRTSRSRASPTTPTSRRG